MLKCIIEHNHVRAGCSGLHGARHSIRIRNHRYPGIQPPVDKHLILTVPTQYDRRTRTGRLQALHKPRGNGSLSCSTHRQVPDTDTGQRERVRGQHSRIKRPIPECRHPAVEPADWCQERAHRPSIGLGRFPNRIDVRPMHGER